MKVVDVAVVCFFVLFIGVAILGLVAEIGKMLTWIKWGFG